MRVLILGASGMIGSAMMRVLSEKKDWQVFGSIRDGSLRYLFSDEISKHLIGGINVEDFDSLVGILDKVQPDLVVNCVGLIKHKSEADDLLDSVAINALMPHRLAKLCKLIGARLIHLSTDCVFSGDKGNYSEDDFSDARDIYGRTKVLGELNYPHTITLRTSFIGHELITKFSLLDWFLSQENRCNGYAHAIFSGLPTIVFAEMIRDVLIPKPELTGLYHVGAKPISKYDLLKIIANVYQKNIEITRDEGLIIDRSLDSTRFELATGYKAQLWPELIKIMHKNK